MGTFKGTKGEWIYCGGDNGSAEIQIGDTVASFTRDDRNTGKYVISREEMEANAKLASYAPRMLELIYELAENLSIQLERQGCCGEGDGKDRKADLDSLGGSTLLLDARYLINKATD